MPNLPEHYGFGLLADFGRDSEWAIYNVKFLEDKPTADGLEIVPDDLCVLLYSAEAYSPALAIARDAMARRWQGNAPSRAEFAVCYVEILRRLLKAQADSPYRLAEVLVEELGYLAKGEFVWILRYDAPSHEVSWVSSDFFVYRNSADDFDLDDDALASLTSDETA